MAKKTKAPAALPPGITAADLEWPRYPADGSGPERAAYHSARGAGNHGQLTYYLVQGGKAPYWVIATLEIARGKGGRADRTYAIGIDDGQVCRVGQGPHVLAVVTVQIGPANIDRLEKHIQLYNKGLAAAGVIRDRIGTRRAQGQLRRAGNPFFTPWDA